MKVIAVDWDCSATGVASQALPAGIQQRSAKPCLNAFWMSERPSGAPGGHQRVLGRILRVMVIAQQQARGSVAALEPIHEEGAELFFGQAGCSGVSRLLLTCDHNSPCQVHAHTDAAAGRNVQSPHGHANGRVVRVWLPPLSGLEGKNYARSVVIAAAGLL
jgi:hypothetical protein